MRVGCSKMHIGTRRCVAVRERSIGTGKMRDVGLREDSWDSEKVCILDPSGFAGVAGKLKDLHQVVGPQDVTT